MTCERFTPDQLTSAQVMLSQSVGQLLRQTEYTDPEHGPRPPPRNRDGSEHGLRTAQRVDGERAPLCYLQEAR